MNESYELSALGQELHYNEDIRELIKEGHSTRSAKRLLAKQKRLRAKRWAKQHNKRK